MAGKYPKTIIITTAQKGGEPFKEFIAGLETRAKQAKNSEIWIMPTNGKDKKAELSPYFQDKNKFKIMPRTYLLNSNVLLMQDLTIPAENVNPLLGIARHVPTGKTAILPATKLMMKTYTDSKKEHRTLIATGAVTRPDYSTSHKGQVARLDHHYSAVILEVEDDQRYHFRQLNADASGVFYDLGYRYERSKKPKFERLEALVLGDWHEGDNPEEVIEATKAMIIEFQPKRIYIHDLFAGDEIDYWHKEDKAYQADKAKKGSSIKVTLHNCWKRLRWFEDISPKDTKIKIDKSNHDERLYNYLKEGTFLADSINSKEGAMLYSRMGEGVDPLIEGIKLFGGDIPKRVYFLQRADTEEIHGWTLGVHGDRGPAGKKATTASMSENYDAIVAGHGHYDEIFRNVWRVGTSSELNPEFTSGSPSNWMHSNLSMPSNWHPQLIRIIDGEYKAA